MLTATVTDTAAQSSSDLRAKEAGLGQQDFLRMLIAQLENQDPLNPQESTEFSAQLAQFSSLEQSIGMRESLESINAALGRTDSVTAIGMIGQEVLAEGNQFELGGNGATLRFDLADASDTTRVDISDARGKLVASLSVGALSRGPHRIEWDGMGSDGTPRAPGVYGVTVVASADAKPIEATSLVAARVTGANVTGSQPILLLGDMLLPLSSVREVRGPRGPEPLP